MLKLKFYGEEMWDEENECFIYKEKKVLRLEHSLHSMYEWESKWNKPFFNKKEEKTPEESLDYIKCMIIDDIDDHDWLNSSLTKKHIQMVNEYIDSPMTATWFSDDKMRRQPSRQTITAEIIYFWMIQSGIPPQWGERLHLNKLLTLIRVCGEMSKGPKRKGKANKDSLRRRHDLNARRKAELNTRG